MLSKFVDSRSRSILSVDVEDYFHVEAFADCVPRHTWEMYPLRVEYNTRQLLDLFDQYETKATFFVLGWVAERLPALLREIHNRGHELGCHSYWHRCVYQLNPEEFRDDTRRALDVIQQATGVRTVGYRAPSWSITQQSLWALDILADEGFEYDSSIYPIHHDIYGIPGAGASPYVHALADGRSLQEFPPATVRLLGATLPAAGGGYLRILPFIYTKWAVQHIAEDGSNLLVVYLHPWEIDPSQPRIRSKFRSRFRHYTNLARMRGRLIQLLSTCSFQSFRQMLNSTLCT